MVFGFFSWVWQCNEQRANGIPFCMNLPFCREDDCDSICLVFFLRYWPDWIVFWFRTKGGSVLGCATRTSVASFVGEQPWTRAPRCCYPRSKWSMMGSIFSETYYLPREEFCHCFFIWTYATISAILLTTKSLSLRKATTCRLLETKERAFLQIEGF